MPNTPDQALPMIELIAAVIGEGAPDPRTRLAAAALHRRGLAAFLGPQVRWGRPVVSRAQPRPLSVAGPGGVPQAPSGDLTAGHLPAQVRLDIVEAFSRRLAHRVSECLLSGALPLVIGGDHSCAIGTWSGVARVTGAGRLGLLWIDAHLDAHVPATSPSQMPHGMPLAALLGEGPTALTHLAGAPPVLDAARVVVLGARSWEAPETQRLSQRGVRVISAQEVRARGLTVCLVEALKRVRGEPGGVWGLSLDVDAVDPVDLPATGTPVPEGLSLSGLCEGLRGIVQREGLKAIEIAEYNPRLDPGCVSAGRLIDLIAALLLRAPP
jgi:arginase